MSECGTCGHPDCPDCNPPTTTIVPLPPQSVVPVSRKLWDAAQQWRDARKAAMRSVTPETFARLAKAESDLTRQVDLHTPGFDAIDDALK